MTPSEENIPQPCICGNTECPITFGYCHCGCGGKTRLATTTNPKWKWIEGLPVRYIRHHGYKKENGQTPEQKREYRKIYQEKNRERIKALKKQYRQDRKEEITTYNKRYVEEHLEAVLQKGRENTAYYVKHFPEKFLLWSAKRRAKSKSLPFNIEESDITIPVNCPILGVPLKRSKKYGASDSPTLDRIIPALGYIKGNIQVISNMANRMKQDATFEQMAKLGEWANMMMCTTCAVKG